ncbi:hypothetical protein DdX_17860 [Ditylenchus destructor]|uniref:Uncharacterized protein n=1 Tax=Ditylenchus destructor TaxID=166010 RepID=A0AAD4MKX5_9BILA|nr:hypothetical protein DdX_17860 [Ditylenchus destructor]
MYEVGRLRREIGGEILKIPKIHEFQDFAHLYLLSELSIDVSPDPKRPLPFYVTHVTQDAGGVESGKKQTQKLPPYDLIAIFVTFYVTRFINTNLET